MPVSDNEHILNTSGFPFQMKIAQEIRDSPGRHDWKVLAEEHPWKSSESEDYGFIDIVAGYGAVRLVIECKRGADATWLFLGTKSDGKPIDRIYALCTDTDQDEPDIEAWARFGLKPLSPQTPFCIVRGQGDKEPMLERIATTLILSAESLAQEELRIGRMERVHNYKFIIPVIITTARLLFCPLDPKKVDLSNGKVPTEESVFEEVKLVRFQKAFGVSRGGPAETVEQAHQDSLRTVIVIHASEVVSFLDQVTLYPEYIYEKWPNERIRIAMRTAKAIKPAAL